MAVLHVIISIALSLFSPPPLFSTFSNFLKGNSFHLNFRYKDNPSNTENNEKSYIKMQHYFDQKCSHLWITFKIQENFPLCNIFEYTCKK